MVMHLRRLNVLTISENALTTQRAELFGFVINVLCFEAPGSGRFIIRKFRQ